MTGFQEQDTKSYVARELLEKLIDRSISEKLDAVAREFRSFTGDMDKEKKRVAALLVLSMVRASCNTYFEKMGARIEASVNTKK